MLLRRGRKRRIRTVILSPLHYEVPTRQQCALVAAFVCPARQCARQTRQTLLWEGAQGWPFISFISAHFLRRQLLRGRFGMRQAVIAEFAHAHLVDRLVWPSALGTRLANAIVEQLFLSRPHGGSSHDLLSGILG